MRLINKKDLTVIDGMLVEKSSLKLVFVANLDDEYNEIIELDELLDFVEINSAKIEANADGKRVEFTLASIQKPRFTTGTSKPATPLVDEAKAHAEAVALEFLELQNYDDVEHNLKRYPALAQFLSSDYVLFDEDYCAKQIFKGNVLEITEVDIVATITAYHDPAIRKLINNVVIKP
jgi:hypothetical protein